MNKRRRNNVRCLNCGKVFYPEHSSKGKYCSNACQGEYQGNIKYQRYLSNPDSYNGVTISWVKKHILKEQNFRCSICGMKNEWQGKPLVFILDHINGDSYLNRRDNLRLVCPNCDSQLDTISLKTKVAFVVITDTIRVIFCLRLLEKV